MLAIASKMGAVASISDRVGDVGGYLREQREHARLSVRQLATLAGVSNPYLSQVERGLRKPSAEVLQQIARGLRISAEALYVRAGILDQVGRPDVEAAVNADPELNERQRRVLLDIYASFRAENHRAVQEAVQESAGGSVAARAAVRKPIRRTARPSTGAASGSAGPALGAGPLDEPVIGLRAAADLTAADLTAADPPAATGRLRSRRAPGERAVPRTPRRTTARSGRAARKSTASAGPTPADDTDTDTDTDTDS
jgi:transcriptional regulator with XRE-family HTH domain